MRLLLACVTEKYHTPGPHLFFFISGARMAKTKQNKREITIWLLQQLLYFISDVRTSTHLK